MPTDKTITVSELRENLWNDSQSDNRFYQFNVNSTLNSDQLKLVENAIEKVLNNETIEDENY